VHGRSRRAFTALAAGLLTAGLAGGCTGGDDGAAEAKATPTPKEQRTVRLPVRDGNIRQVGEPCSGAGGYLYIHADAPFTVTDAAGSAAATGTMPQGKARAALDEELGVPRVPTFCEFSVPVTVPAGTGYSLTFDRGDPIPLTAQDDKVEGKILVGVL